MKRELRLLGPLAACVLAAFIACRSEESAAPRSQAPSGSSSSGGLDAALPEAPLDCGPPPGAAAPFSKQALIGACAKCAAWHACNFQNAAVVLRSSLGAERGAAQGAWKTAMAAWSKMELFQFGPLGNRSADPYHGRGLRSFVHPWPDHDRCEVEKQVVAKPNIDTVLPTGRGLFALEYLLHYPGADTVCLPGSATGQAWATLDVPSAKAAYASAVGDNLVALALEIRNVWLPEGENFEAKLLSAEGYGSEQEVLNVIAWSLFYVEREVKDWKLGGRAGMQPTTTRPESPFAGLETDNMRLNLKAFRSLFQGCSDDGSGVGFDDWLVAAGHAQLSQDILTALATAEAAAAAFPAYAEASEAQFVAFYNGMKPLSDLLKTSLFGSASPLNLKLPATAASDTD